MVYAFIKCFFRFLSKEEFDDIVRFVTQQKHFSIADGGFVEKKDEFKMWVWVAGDDDEEEGKFFTWYTNEPMPYLPWAPNCPFKGSATFNFIQIALVAGQNGTEKIMKSALIFDYDLTYGGNPVCIVKSTVAKLRLRGLCKDFSFNREFLHNK